MQQHDPFSDAHVISRGIVGPAVDGVEVPTVASPMYKQVFDLHDGPVPRRRGQGARPDLRADLRTWPVRVRDGIVEVGS